jgi:hypothetical protein
MALAACSAGAYSSVDEIPEDRAPPGAPQHFGLGLFAARSLYVGDGASKSMREILAAQHRSSSSSLLIGDAHIYNDSMSLQVYRGGIDFDEWIWRNGSITGPTPVHGTTERDAAGVFDVSRVPWDKVPAIRRAALDAAGLEGGRLGGIYVRSAEGKIRMTASVHGVRHDATFTFDERGDRIE